MKRNTLLAALSASLLFCATNLSIAADKVQDPADHSATVRTAKPPSNKPNAKSGAKMKEAAKIKLVDINGATSEEIKKLPGISDAEAAKIIAGRPYGSKAWLVSHNIIPADKYPAIKDLVIAKQPFKDGEKNAALYAPKKESKK